MTFPRTHRRTLAAAASVFASAAMVTTMIGAPAAASATGEILSAGGATAVADSYIVVLKDTSVGGSAGTRQGEVKSTAGSLAARFGGSVGHVYGDALNGFEVKLSERAAKRLAAHPDVDYVEQNHSVSTMATQNNPPWGWTASTSGPCRSAVATPTTAPAPT